MASENIISKAIVQTYSEKLTDSLNVDVALVGAGPSALVASRYLAEAGFKTAIFESRLAPGGGVPCQKIRLLTSPKSRARARDI